MLLLLIVLMLLTNVHITSLTMNPATGKKIGSQSKPLYEERCLFVDNDIIVYDKPPNMLSVPGMYEKDSLTSRIAATFHIERQDQMIGKHFVFFSAPLPTVAKLVHVLETPPTLLITMFTIRTNTLHV